MYKKTYTSYRFELVGVQRIIFIEQVPSFNLVASTLSGAFTQSNSVYVVNSAEVRVEDFPKKGAENVTVRYLVDERQGANKFSLRLYAVGKSGCTPFDRHEYEHQVYVLRGEGVLKTGEGGSILRRLREGDTIFIPSNAVHQFLNEKEERLVFLCVKGNPTIYRSGTIGGQTLGNEAEENSC